MAAPFGQSRERHGDCFAERVLLLVPCGGQGAAVLAALHCSSRNKAPPHLQLEMAGDCCSELFLGDSFSNRHAIKGRIFGKRGHLQHEMQKLEVAAAGELKPGWPNPPHFSAESNVADRNLFICALAAVVSMMGRKR